MTKTIQRREPRVSIRTDNLIRYVSEDGERVELRLGEIFQSGYNQTEYCGRGALLTVFGNNREFLRGEDIYRTLSEPFAQQELRAAADDRVDSETFRQTIEDILAEMPSEEVLQEN